MKRQGWQERCGDCPHCAREPSGQIDTFGRATVFQWSCCAQLPHVEPPADCALEELNMWLADNALPEEARDWLLAWANRRAANVIEFLAEPMREIAEMATLDGAAGAPRWQDSFEAAQFVARQALKVCAIQQGDEDEHH